jgi:hypothetical protein
MRLIAGVATLCVVAVSAVHAQQPDSLKRKARADSLRADSIAKARQDSIALVRELERTLAQPPSKMPPAVPAQGIGPTNPRLLPDISAVGDFISDLSPKGSTQPDSVRFSVREVELAFQAVVDPYFRGDVFLGINDVEKVSIEQAFLTTTSLRDVELRFGRYLMPFGKVNTVHRHDLHTVEYPWVEQLFLSPDALKGTGGYVSRVFAPFGFYQEVLLTAVDRFGEAPEGLRTATPVNKNLNGLAYSARLRNYWDLTQNANVELGGSAITGLVEQPIIVESPVPGVTAVIPSTSPNAVGARQSLFGVDFTYRWRPLQQGLYRSFIFQSEVMRQVNAQNVVAPGCAAVGLAPTECDVTSYGGPTRSFTGAYAFARWQVTQRAFLGARYDWVQDPNDPTGAGRNLTAGSGYLEWFPSEFSKVVASYERYAPPGTPAINRILFQAAMALGPHKPHPF